MATGQCSQCGQHFDTWLRGAIKPAYCDPCARELIPLYEPPGPVFRPVPDPGDLIDFDCAPLWLEHYRRRGLTSRRGGS